MWVFRDVKATVSTKKKPLTLTIEQEYRRQNCHLVIVVPHDEYIVDHTLHLPVHKVEMLKKTLNLTCIIIDWQASDPCKREIKNEQ